MKSRALWIFVALALVVLGPVRALAGGSTHRRHAPAIIAGAPESSASASESILAPTGSSASATGPSPAGSSASAAVGSFGTWDRGSWCWFADPRAVRVVGRYDQTFVGWIDWGGTVMVGAYDSTFGVTRRHVVGHLDHDDHGSPSIFVEPDKRLTVFFSGHDGSAMYYRTTLRPEDISAWGPIQQLPVHMPGALGFTYPNPVALPAEGNRLYLFWRGATWSADYATRSLDGRWSQGHELISKPGERPYVKVASNGNDEIALAFTNGHPRERKTSLYYAAYRSGALWTASGRRIASVNQLPIAPRQADLIYDGNATGISSWVWDVALDSHGYPVIVYATFPSAQRHLYWYARFNGRRWVSHYMTVGGPTISPDTIEIEYSGGMALDHSNPSVVYVSRKVQGWYEIERWVTPDGGASWTHTTVVRTPGADNVRPVIARGSDGGPMSLLWLHGHYGDYTDYRTSVSFLR